MTESEAIIVAAEMDAIASSSVTRRDSNLGSESDVIPKEPYMLPLGYKFFNVDLNNSEQMQDMSTLVSNNERETTNFPTIFTPQHLKWLMQQPDYNPEWIVGVRPQDSDRLVACISAIPSKLNMWDTEFNVAHLIIYCVNGVENNRSEIQFLLMHELKRRINLAGVFQLTFASHKPEKSQQISCCQCYARMLNPEKMINIGYSQLEPNMTIQQSIKKYKLPAEPLIPGFRRIEANDMMKAYKLFETYMKSIWLHPVFTYEEFCHIFTPQEGIIDCFVVENRKGQITDMTSYVYAPISIPQQPLYKTLTNAVSFYNITTKTPLKKLIKDCLISARNAQVDMFFATNLLQNDKFLSPLRFSMLDVRKYYYIQNCLCPFVDREKVAIMFL